MHRQSPLRTILLPRAMATVVSATALLGLLLAGCSAGALPDGMLTGELYYDGCRSDKCFPAANLKAPNRGDRSGVKETLMLVDLGTVNGEECSTASLSSQLLNLGDGEGHPRLVGRGTLGEPVGVGRRSFTIPYDPARINPDSDYVIFVDYYAWWTLDTCLRHGGSKSYPGVRSGGHGGLPKHCRFGVPVLTKGRPQKGIEIELEAREVMS